MPRILHLLSQRPSLTGSGVTLDALVHHAADGGWDQEVVVGVPADDPFPVVDGLTSDRIHTVRFGIGDLSFPVPGMSDVMPYRSTRWSDMSPDQLEAYRIAWTARLAAVIQEFEPDVIHAHHIWLMGSLIKDVAPSTPVVSHCHATGLRQMQLCPDLGNTIARKVARNDSFVVLHDAHATELQRILHIDRERITVVGAGYREDLFHANDRTGERVHRILYVGKYSEAKGLPWLLDAFDRVRTEHPGAELHIAGSGSGPEGEELRRRMLTMSPAVTLHGQLDQVQLADLMRRCGTCVLPSFFEGLPLVLIEAAACGCRIVATGLPGVVTTIAPHLGSALDLVTLPRLTGPDTPVAADLPAFTGRLEDALKRALGAPPPDVPPDALRTFTWAGVYERVESVWKRLISVSEQHS